MSCYRVPLLDVVMTMAGAVDLVSPVVAQHHRRVAYLAWHLAREIGLTTAATHDLVVAAALHDVGAFSLEERVRTLQFEFEAPHRHAALGAAFLGRFGPFADIAEIVRCHHVPWAWGAGWTFGGRPVPPASHLLHLADRIDVLAAQSNNILAEVDRIAAQITEASGSLFLPEAVRAFEHFAEREYVWLDLQAANLGDILRRGLEPEILELDHDHMVGMAHMLSHLVDFRSGYTSTHTAGVAHTAAALAELAGLPPARCREVLLAGYLHDLGKLAVPREILDKPARLDREELGLMKAHAYFTRRILSSVEGLGEIAIWASSHHERLDGRGYPFHDQTLSVESRVLAVADVFTAISEDRPYRAGMSRDESERELLAMAASGKLDPGLVDLALAHHDHLDRIRRSVQERARTDYEQLVAAHTAGDSVVA